MNEIDIELVNILSKTDFLNRGHQERGKSRWTEENLSIWNMWQTEIRPDRMWWFHGPVHYYKLKIIPIFLNYANMLCYNHMLNYKPAKLESLRDSPALTL